MDCFVQFFAWFFELFFVNFELGVLSWHIS